MIRVRLLGESEITIGRRRITLSTEVIFALGLYLCVRAGERLSRDLVVETFWGSSDAKKGRHSLRQMLYRLRQKGFTLDEEGEELVLDPARIDSDVTRVLAKSWPESAAPAEVERAGRAMPTFTRHISERFQEWYDGVRDEVARQHRLASLEQIAHARREGRWADLEIWARQALQSDPLNEQATFARAASAAMAGSPSMAMEILDQYVEELGPRASQIGLPAEVLRRRIAEHRPTWSMRGPREVAMVGREGLMARLTGLVDAAGRGEGSAVVLWGAPGVGKSRLAAELINYCEISGFRSVRLRAAAPNRAQPLSVILGLAPLLAAVPGAAGCHPSHLSLLARASRQHELGTPALSPPYTAAIDDGAVVAALVDLLSALSDEGRLLIFVDDMQNSDPRSRRLLLDLISRTSERRILWLSTSRTRQVENDTTSHDCPSRPLELLVPPLGQDASTTLVASVCLAEGLHATPEEHARIATASGGNPLFVRELSLHSKRTSAPQSLPRSLREVMSERLSLLSADQSRLLQLLAILGAHATVSRLRALTGLDSSALSAALEVLEHEGVVRMTADRTLDLHDCWHAAVVEHTSPIVRASLSLDCAVQLNCDNVCPPSVSERWRAAELFAEAADHNRSAALFQQIADQMYSRGLVADATTILERALCLSGNDRASLPLRMRHARALFASGRLSEALEACDTALRFDAPALEEEGGAAVALACIRLESLLKLKQEHAAALNTVARLSRDPKISSEARQLACLTGIVVAFNNTSSEYEDLFYEQSQALLARDSGSVMGMLVGLIHGAERGNESGVLAFDARLQDADLRSIADPLRCRILRSRSTAMRWSGHTSRAFALGEQAFSQASTSGLIGDAALVAESMVFTALDSLNDEALALWMSRWDECLPADAYFERARARTHAQSRLHIRTSDYDAALAAYGSHVLDLNSDPAGKRRATDQATIAYCLAMIGKREASKDALLPSIEVLSACRPSTQVDYIAEFVLRSLEALGDGEWKQRVAVEYVSRRAREYEFPVPRAFTALSQSLRAHLEDRITRG